MAFQKHHRLDMRAVRGLHRNMKALLQPGRQHPKLSARYAEHAVQVTVSSSPFCEENVKRHCLHDVIGRFAAMGVEFEA